MSESSSSGEELQLSLDPDGRPMGVGGEDLNFQFRSFTNLLPTLDEQGWDGLIHDCEAAFTARSVSKKNKESGYSSGDTYFLAATDAPRNALERLARAVFDFHSAGADFDPACSGAEWWTQCLQVL